MDETEIRWPNKADGAEPAPRLFVDSFGLVISFCLSLLSVSARVAHPRRSASMTAQDYNSLQLQLCGESNAILADVGLRPEDAYNAMLREPEMLMTWWSGVFEQSEADEKSIHAAARAFAAGKPLPDLTVPQRARLALRLRLGSRIVRAISSRQHIQPKGWFPNKLRRMSSRELVEWVLIDGWHFCAEIFDEAMSWADGVEPPLAPSTRRPPPASSGAETSSLVE